MTQKSEPVAGFGRKVPQRYFRDDLDDLSEVAAESELNSQIVRLLALHSSLKVQFRNQDLASLDNSTKKRLLADMYAVLGVRPLRKNQR